jgi:hypothetical protein
MKNMLAAAVIAVYFCAPAMNGTLFGQSAEAMDDILEAEHISFGQASYLLLVAREELDADADFSTAADLMTERLPSAVGRGYADGMSLGGFSYLLMEFYGRPGGLMYGFFPGPRYAVRQLAFDEVIQGRAYPNTPLSGERALRILERFLYLFESEDGGGEA